MTLGISSKRMPVTHQQWQELMKRDIFSGAFRNLRKIGSKTVKSRGKSWFLKTCLVMGLVPATLQPNDIMHDRVEKAEPKHFTDTRSWKENLVMTPFKLIKPRDPWVRLHFERDFINKHNFIEMGINRVL